jgi:hypothetical protein
MQARMQQGRLTDVDRYMTAAQGAAKRAAALTHRLLAFSPGDACQQVVEVVCQATGELAHRFHLLRLPQRLLCHAELGFRPQASRDVLGMVYTVTEPFGDPNLVKPYWEVSYSPLHDAAGRIIGAFHSRMVGAWSGGNRSGKTSPSCT